ncbi:MAG: hypothetical protein CL940_04650 [Deltaproteobacteria bacterium]|nr:hypothetical protein [Deltaproteobacteria bacterium]|tara:strand:- start:169 stop:597 length:429 start_codon:yes stop_codon:yes gene_type:complete
MNDVKDENEERDRSRARTWLARGVLLVMVIGAIGFFNSRQIEAYVALGVGPVMRADDGAGLKREAVEVIHLTLRDSDGEPVAQSVMHLPQGIQGPATPAMAVRVPRGSYLAEVRLQGPESRRATRTKQLHLTESGYQHLDLD